jgi:hypothetical protein
MPMKSWSPCIYTCGYPYVGIEYASALLSLGLR